MITISFLTMFNSTLFTRALRTHLCSAGLVGLASVTIFVFEAFCFSVDVWTDANCIKAYCSIILFVYSVYLYLFVQNVCSLSYSESVLQ